MVALRGDRSLNDGPQEPCALSGLPQGFLLVNLCRSQMIMLQSKKQAQRH